MSGKLNPEIDSLFFTLAARSNVMVHYFTDDLNLEWWWRSEGARWKEGTCDRETLMNLFRIIQIPPALFSVYYLFLPSNVVGHEWKDLDGDGSMLRTEYDRSDWLDKH